MSLVDGGPSDDAGALDDDSGAEPREVDAGDAGDSLDAGHDASERDAGALDADAGSEPDAGESDAGGDAGSDGGAEENCAGCVRSALYPEAWTPGYTAPSGLFLHDFSYAGYRGGEEPAEDLAGPRVSVVDHGADPTGEGDSTAAFQAAIDAASALGGGVVEVPAGDYRCDDNLVVTSSHLVLQGAGPELSRVAFAKSSGMTDQANVSFRATLSYGPHLPLAMDGEARSHEVSVTDASSLAPGDDVVVGWVITPGFVEEHGMTGTWTAFTGQYKEIFRRQVVGVDIGSVPHRVTLDVPLRYSAEVAHEASVRKETGHLEEVGLEDLGVSNAITWNDAWSFDRAHVVLFDGVKDGWLRRVASFEPWDVADDQGGELMSGGVKVLRSKRVTVANVTFRKSQNRGPGGNGYLFEVSKSNEVLIRDSVGEGGRHNFIQNWDFGTAGCVFLRTESRGGRIYNSSSSSLWWPGLSEFHHSLAMANLIDASLTDDGWQAVQRGTESSGAGHTSTETVFWNVRGSGALNSWQAGHGYVIGTSGVTVRTDIPSFDITGRSTGTAPEDWLEHEGAANELRPSSLYEDQRARRLAAP